MCDLDMTFKPCNTTIGLRRTAYSLRNVVVNLFTEPGDCIRLSVMMNFLSELCARSLVTLTDDL